MGILRVVLSFISIGIALSFADAMRKGYPLKEHIGKLIACALLNVVPLLVLLLS